MTDSDAILSKIAQNTAILNEIKTDVLLLTVKTNESHQVLLGNGDPEKGLQNQVAFVKKDLATLTADFTEHKLQHKERDNKAFDIVKPLAIIILGWILTGSITFAILSQYIKPLLHD